VAAADVRPETDPCGRSSQRLRSARGAMDCDKSGGVPIGEDVGQGNYHGFGISLYVRFDASGACGVSEGHACGGV